MKSFFFFSIYRMRCWITNSGAKEPNFVIHAMMATIWALNLVTVINLAGFVTGRPLRMGSLGDMEHGPKLYLAVILYGVLAHVILGKLKVLESAGSERMRLEYKTTGFKNMHAVAYFVASFVLYVGSEFISAGK